jgi:hypothetical protein
VTAAGHRNAQAIEYLLANGYAVTSDLGLNVIFRRNAGASS